MRCTYCFYADEIKHRSVAQYEFMSIRTLENIIKKAFDYAEGVCTFGFQGGEPTLIGLDFYKTMVELVRKHNKKKIKVEYALQTNGLEVDEEWAEFFHNNDFLLGLSLDGVKSIHDTYRLDASGNGTFSRVMKTAHIFNKYNVKYNVLIVITNQIASHINQVYNALIHNGFFYQQYIPCLDPLGEDRGKHPYSLTPQNYGNCLIRLFDAWYCDMAKGNEVYIRDFENLAGMILGRFPERCGLSGVCRNQNVIEADGSVYPCDFYVLDEFRIGNLNENNFDELGRRCIEIGFVESSMRVEEICKTCKWVRFCRGGCRRDRQCKKLDEIGLNYFCSAYQLFYAHAIPKLLALI